MYRLSLSFRETIPYRAWWKDSLTHPTPPTNTKRKKEITSLNGGRSNFLCQTFIWFSSSGGLMLWRRATLFVFGQCHCKDHKIPDKMNDKCIHKCRWPTWHMAQAITTSEWQITWSQGHRLHYHNRWGGWQGEDGRDEGCSPGGLAIDWYKKEGLFSGWHRYILVPPLWSLIMALGTTGRGPLCKQSLGKW